jgi:hypothetical protein
MKSENDNCDHCGHVRAAHFEQAHVNCNGESWDEASGQYVECRCVEFEEPES